MDSGDVLQQFFNAIGNDPRIGASHISLYCAILNLSIGYGIDEAVLVVSSELMKCAKISGVATYHKCIRDLNSFGYITYMPSFNHRKKSKIFLSAGRR